MRNEPRVSILIPCYNAEKWIRQCIQSALDQTYPNKEVIVVDDGSKDRSWEIITSFGNQIRCARGENRGANAARNQLTAMSSGEWLQYLDADDYLLPDKVERQMAHAAEHPGVDLIYSPVINLCEARGVLEAVEIDYSQDEIFHYIGWTAFATHAMLMSKAAVLDVGGWEESQPCCQEHELLMRFLLNRKRFSACNHAGAIYRHHGLDTVSKRSPSRVVRERMALTDRMERRLLTIEGMTPAYKRALCQARFDSARSMHPFDHEYANMLIRRNKATSRWFIPRGPSARPFYRTVYILLGFHFAEALAAANRWFVPRIKHFAASIFNLA